MAFTYHGPDQLQQLGEKIRDKAISVTMDQAASYAAAQQAAVNDATRSDTGQVTQVPGYTTPAGGRPDDEGNLLAYVAQAYAGIPAMFASFALPNPDDCRPMLDALYAVAATVKVDLTMTSRNSSVAAPDAVAPLPGTAHVADIVDAAKLHLKEWIGNAANSFEHYLDVNARAAVLQREVTLSLALSLEAQLEINRRVNTDIWEIGQKTYKALDGLDAWCPGGNASKASALLTIGGAIAAVIFAGATAGAGTAALAAAVSVEGWQSLATIWSNSKPLQEKKVDIGGRTVPPIITGMQNAINLLTKTLDTQNQELVNGLSKFTDAFHHNWNDVLIAAPDKFTKLRSADRDTISGTDGMFVR
ncbi:hypothetical protein ACIBSW_12600 [Actinoplanes sp. NPDC049668]|uniref:hypothetical protein n=1 Tax=unclassified Actinoplanes TaxID=2626549 RepID=UPI0033AF089C